MFMLLMPSLVQSLCQNTTLLKHASPKEVSSSVLPFCSEHNTRTCCDTASALSIYKKFYRVLTEPPHFDGYSGYSSNCMQYTQKAFCHECDGDIGEGLRSGLCADFCSKWFQSCEFDYFVANSADLEFCTANSLICFQLRDIGKGGDFMCKSFGFKVKSSDCYNGVTSASRKGPVKVNKSQSSWNTYLRIILLVVLVVLLGAGVFFFYYKKIASYNFDIREARIKRLEANDM